MWDAGSIPGLGRSPGGGNGNLLQYSCLNKSRDRGARQAAVHGVAKSQTRVSTHTCPGYCEQCCCELWVHVSFWTVIFSGYMPSSGIAGSCGDSIFSLLSNLYTVLHSGCTSSHSHPQFMTAPFVPVITIIIRGKCYIISAALPPFLPPSCTLHPTKP